MALGAGRVGPPSRDVVAPPALLDASQDEPALHLDELRRDMCPACGVASFVYEEGCKKCYSCGHSEC